jgi:hypothetical protein
MTIVLIVVIVFAIRSVRMLMLVFLGMVMIVIAIWSVLVLRHVSSSINRDKENCRRFSVYALLRHGWSPAEPGDRRHHHHHHRRRHRHDVRRESVE